MNSHEIIFIYEFFPNDLESPDLGQHYKCLNVFDHNGRIEQFPDFVSVHVDSKTQKMTFDSIDDLKSYAKELALYHGSHHVRLLSTSELNICIDSSTTRDDFLDQINSSGERLEISQRSLFQKISSWMQRSRP